MNLVKQRQGKFLGFRPVYDVNRNYLRTEPIYSKKPFRALTVAKTLNTDVVCRVCMGSGQIISDSSRIGLIENTCGKCHGTKRMRAI